MDDSAVLSLLEGAERTVDLHRELENLLRKGFVELSSAKFSKGLVGNTLVSPDGFPAEARALRVIDANEPCTDDAARFSLHLRRTSSPENADENEDKQEEKEGLRQRKLASQSSPAQDDSTSVKQSKHRTDDPLYRWLRMKPRNQLERAQTAFTQSLALIVELAEHKLLLAATASDVKVPTSQDDDTDESATQ
ncbi:Hypothetical Protein FCC1311_053302 [Hondaea fermentalgiana]|uniref:Vacuolar ATPase assembly protein VMA22 n=1 Tax=Hondaea fermentalgiana TaxID=2315210 RepID=A0A2R5GDU8_9STRA|nr:Hypothetical Protein FCC1311_053302 [Hondaea fermentalgiana]|eukprot:GBG29107.1 Hypothetical Protein FCC1311_053302 [Hondaea fermentalgiana]